MFKFYILFLFVICFSFGANSQNSVIVSPVDTVFNDTISTFSISNLNNEIDKTKKIILRNKQEKSDSLNITSLNNKIKKHSDFLHHEYKVFKLYDTTTLSRVFLETTYRVWVKYYDFLVDWREESYSMYESEGQKLEELIKLQKEWEATVYKLHFNKNSEAISLRIKLLIDQIKASIKTHSELSARLLETEDNIVSNITFTEQTIDEIKALLNQKEQSVFVTSKGIWALESYGSNHSFWNKINYTNYTNARLLRNYLLVTKQLLTRYFVFFILLVLSLLLLRFFVKQQVVLGNIKANSQISRILVQSIGSVIALISIVLWQVVFPYTPILFYNLLRIASAFFIVLTLLNFISSSDKKLILAITALLAINNLEVYTWQFNEGVRWFVLFESVISFSFWLVIFGLIRRKKLNNSSVFKDWLNIISPIMLFLSAVSALSNVLFYPLLSVYILKVSVRLIYLFLLLYSFIKIFTSVVEATVAFLETKWDYALKILPSLKKYLTVLVYIFLWVEFFNMMLRVGEFDKTISIWIKDLVFFEFTINQTTFEIADILLFLLTLFSGFALSSLVNRIFKTEEKRISLTPKRYLQAVSLSIRIVVVSLAFVIALPIVGINLNKFSLIAGALGVGIGFGLQNIVQNFISGLILIYGRPINIGDTVEVNHLIGKVESIGIRSSNVKTFDGAEVIVPNSNLVSDQLINWTLSDTKRRIEILIGTEYGSNPELVLQILLKVTKQHNRVAMLPEPTAYFLGFGDSALNFRLLYWVQYEYGQLTKSEISIEIYKEFQKHQINIPFPQMDVHIKKQDES